MFQRKRDYASEKDKYLKMSLFDKRKLYKCQGNYITLSNIPTWGEYYKKNQLQGLQAILHTAATKKRSASDVFPGVDFIVDREINEKVSLWKGDITTLEIDAIVNATNKSLMGESGVDGAIHAAAGDQLLLQECKTLDGCQTGEAKVTGGYKLPAKYIIHTVGPIVSGSEPQEKERSKLLTACYYNSLSRLLDHNLMTVAFPCISTGIYGYPNTDACATAAVTVRSFLEKHRKNVGRVIFCVFDQQDEDLYKTILRDVFPVDNSPKDGATVAGSLNRKLKEQENPDKENRGDEKNTGVLWSLTDGNGACFTYGEKNDEGLESNLTFNDIEAQYLINKSGKMTFTFKSSSTTFSKSIDLANMTETELHTNQDRLVDTEDAVMDRSKGGATAKEQTWNVPDNWDNEMCRLFPLQRNDQEYHEILEFFNQTAGLQRPTVVSISRIQNVKVYSNFCNRRNALYNDNDDPSKETQMFYGAKPGVVGYIWKGNFRPSHSSASVQFTKESKIAMTYCRPNNDGINFIFIAMVLVGGSVAEQGAMKPPHDSNTVMHDIIVDGETNPKSFAKYDDDFHYPQYLIEFK